MSNDVSEERKDVPYEILEFPVIREPRGNLSFIEGVEGLEHVPFSIKRVYYLYDVPGGAQRGGHAHKELQQVLIAVSGSFDVVLHDGAQSYRVHLNHPAKGLSLPNMMWREIENFSSGSVCLVLASAPYLEADYIRNFDDFQKVSKGKL